MSAWTGPFFVVAALLAAAGLAKLRDPRTTVGALRGMGLRVPSVAVRVGGAVEAAVGIGAIVTGARWLAVLIALSYAAFAGFVGVAMVRHLPIGSCGCFGKVDTPPSWAHLVVNAAAVVVALAAATADTTLGATFDDQPMAGVPFVGLVLVGVYAVVTLLTTVPQLEAIRRETRA